MQDYYPVSTPADPNVQLTIHPDHTESTTPIHVPNLLCILCNRTRPDIAYAVNTVAKYSKNPRVQHWTIAKQVLRYLKGIANFGIVYSRDFVFRRGLRV